jgi:hypothetical protein
VPLSLSSFAIQREIAGFRDERFDSRFNDLTYSQVSSGGGFTVAVTTAGTIEGKKKIARKKGRATIFVFSNVAIKKAVITPKGALSPT